MSACVCVYGDWGCQWPHCKMDSRYNILRWPTLTTIKACVAAHCIYSTVARLLQLWYTTGCKIWNHPATIVHCMVRCPTVAPLQRQLLQLSVTVASEFASTRNWQPIKTCRFSAGKVQLFHAPCHYWNQRVMSLWILHMLQPGPYRLLTTCSLTIICHE